MVNNFDKWYPFQNDFLTDKSQLRILTKLRQGGFTEAISFEGVISADTTPFQNEWVVYVSSGQRQASAIKDRCEWWIRSDPPIGLGLSDKQLLINNSTEIILPNQSGLVFLPSIEETIRGYTARRVYLDEFAHNKKDKTVYQAIAPSLSRQDVPRYLTIISSAFGKRGKFYEIMVNKDNQYPNFSRHKVTIDDAIREGYPIDKQFCKELAGDDISFRQEYMCEFLDDNISLFNYDLILSRVNPDLEDATSEQLKQEGGFYIAGYDPAKKADSGVFIVEEKLPNGNKRIRHVKEFVKIPYYQQLDYITSFIKNCGRINKLRTDETGVGQKIQEDLNRALGNVAEGITYTNAVKEMMITELKADFDTGKIEIPDNTKLINQLHNIERQIMKSGLRRYEASSGEHDDFVFALCNCNSGFGRTREYKISSI